MKSPSFAERIIVWQKKHGRHHLPWQAHTNPVSNPNFSPDPYRIWVSEIMLQQTQVQTVLAYYQRFLTRFPDLASLANAPLDDVLALWSGLGYYARARNLHRAAQNIVAHHHGIFPRQRAAIEALPGIGRSTAAAISVFAYAERAAILDANVKRVLARHAAVTGSPQEARVINKLWDLAEARLPHENLASYTQGLMDLGAQICRAKEPLCSFCPVATDCLALQMQQTAILPTPALRKIKVERHVQLLLIQWQDKILLEKRPSSGIWGGLWSFPELADKQEVPPYLQQRFGITAQLQTLPTRHHLFTHFKLWMTPMLCTVTSQQTRAMEPGLAWHSVASSQDLGLPTPIKRLLQEWAQPKASPNDDQTDMAS